MSFIPLGILAASGAGGGGAAYESIATATANGLSNSITFSSIPSTYQHLQLRILARSLAATGVSDAKINFNGDTGSNYSRHWIYSFDGGAPGALGGSSLTQYGYGYMPGTTSGTDVYAASIIDIHDYASTTKNKTVRTFTGNEKQTDGNAVIILSSGAWFNTNAITSLTVGLTSVNIASGSTFSLYGIKGA
jgi:hypothetical protein